MRGSITSLRPGRLRWWYTQWSPFPKRRVKPSRFEEPVEQLWPDVPPALLQTVYLGPYVHGHMVAYVLSI